MDCRFRSFKKNAVVWSNTEKPRMMDPKGICLIHIEDELKLILYWPSRINFHIPTITKC